MMYFRYLLFRELEGLGCNSRESVCNRSILYSQEEYNSNHYFRGCFDARLSVIAAFCAVFVAPGCFREVGIFCTEKLCILSFTLKKVCLLSLF